MFKLLNINKKLNCRLLSSLFIAIVFASLSCNKKDDSITKPNLLFIFPDQFRPQAMGFMNEDPVLTPNIDKLASEGLVITNAVSNRPLCSPFRGMLMTGKYCFSIGVQSNCNTSSRKYQNYLKEDETTISDILSAKGYSCGYIGKWHLDPPKGPDVDDWQEAVWEAYTPIENRHGFSFWHAYGCNNRHNDPYYWVNDAPVEDTLFPKEWSPIHEANVAIDFIKNPGKETREKGKPWSLFISMNPPHGPYNEVPEKYKAIYKDIHVDSLLNRPNVPKSTKGDIGRKNVQDYFACVTGVDEQIGRILEALKESGQDENTIVVLSADHGEMMGSHGLLQKVVWYEESLRIPFIIKWPDNIQPGKSNLHLSVPDIMPTLLSMLGLENSIPKDVEGENLASSILGNGQNQVLPEFTLYLNPNSESALGGMRGLRNGQYTFVIKRNNEGEVTEYILHDNISDPFQLQNIASSEPVLVQNFEEQLFKKLKEIDDPWIKYSIN